MRRKAIQLAHKTLVVSLPAKWVKQEGVKKGDEIEVIEKGKELVLKSQAGDVPRVERLDISRLDPLINRVLLGTYISGVDEIHLTFDHPQLLEKIQKEILPALVGFEIVEQEKHRCVIKSITESPLEFESLLVRVFNLLESMGEEMAEHLEKGERDLEYISFIDHTVNRFIGFCLRSLNRYGFKEHYKMPSMYAILQGLEHLGDLYKDLAEEIFLGRMKLHSDFLRGLREVNHLLKEYRHLFYHFDDQKAVAFVHHYREVRKRIQKLPSSQLTFLTSALLRVIITELLSNQLTLR